MVYLEAVICCTRILVDGGVDTLVAQCVPNLRLFLRLDRSS